MRFLTFPFIAIGFVAGWMYHAYRIGFHTAMYQVVLAWGASRVTVETVAPPTQGPDSNNETKH